jgi:hypothetical protein
LIIAAGDLDHFPEHVASVPQTLSETGYAGVPDQTSVNVNRRATVFDCDRCLLVPETPRTQPFSLTLMPLSLNRLQFPHSRVSRLIRLPVLCFPPAAALTRIAKSRHLRNTALPAGCRFGGWSRIPSCWNCSWPALSGVRRKKTFRSGR